ncbi:OmpA family protein [Lysobacter sp. K5869]|nr:OmpA family protein [Lysobacter sp. K5869]
MPAWKEVAMTVSASATSIRSAALAIFLTTACSCTQLPRTHSNNSTQGELPSSSCGLSTTSVEFKSGHPRTNESLASALASRSFDLKALVRDKQIIENNPHLKFDVIGYTDYNECNAVACKDLSAARAELVYRWLISRGISPKSLNPPNGRGSVMPLDIGETAEGRARNRRVEILQSVD